MGDYGKVREFCDLEHWLEHKHRILKIDCVGGNADKYRGGEGFNTEHRGLG